ncbi:MULTISPECIES: SusC/RagA family TonB-linked outer membrane protein [Robiginitalea]|uniref:SusC/RagA family TonB-linked outer membrane protein n=1 Tax=Robiginitalea TaxID=252306 RepID=UPI002349993E|nr:MULTISPECIES: SusC/RagA family TonB-linked outer membrane protein [unclassified Robiginitalea]MDC6352851.1 SusC/RagA family TonB-linked outer membrane protein [Robiginitalea sp. PM2]MDC6373983.1 SusC/RagA family TonB-linked outer membrane protein [Robiginitalea sp. SP8]
MKITLLKSLMLVGAFLCFGAAQAQEVSGTVSDAAGPLPGASVVVQGTTTGTQTDFDGNYTLDGVPGDAVLVFSYIGYATQEVPVNGRSTINVTMEEDAQALDEVVIIGYGQTTVKDATGSVTAVSSEDFNSGVIASPEQLIQGKTAGVNISQTSGEPGAGIQVNIRGANSVRANNNPLFVVDGVPLFGQNTDASGDTGNGGSDVGNPLNFLNPNDIESISILKDASATAIYGSRGANGVVIITTKSGRAAAGGKFEWSSNLSVSTPVRQFDLLNREEFLDAVELYGGNRNLVDFGNDTNWQDVVMRTAASSNHNLAYSQNYGSGNVRATFGYQKQFGVVEKSEFERITGRLNLNHRFLDDKLILGLQASISRVNREQPPLAAGAGFRGDILGSAYSANPTWGSSPTFDDGGGQTQPANYLASTQNITNTNRLLVNGSLEYKFTPEFSGKVNLGYDTSDSENTSTLNANLQNFTGIEGIGFGTYNTLDRDNKTLEATLNYTKQFDNSNLDALVGYAYQDFRTQGRNSAGRGFGTTDLNGMGEDLRATVNAAQSVISGSFQQFYYGTNTGNLVVNRLFPTVVAGEVVDGGFSKRVQAITADIFDNTDELQSFFGRVNYSIAGKYLFTGTMRADGSSRFGPENQYGYFPSGAFAWQMGEEDFIGESISTLKLRLSAGITGNQDGLGYGNFVARQRFAGLGINNDASVNQNGLSIVATDVPDLKWESTVNYNIGLDFGFNNDRLNGSIDVYQSTTRDLLLQTPPAAPSTQPFQFGNVDAEIVNQGIEFAISYDFAQSEDFNFSSSFNIAYNENEIQNFAGAINTGEINGPGLSGAFAQRFESGVSLFSFYMAEFTGFDSDGNPQYVDIDGNGIGDPDADKSFVGEDGLPDITTGLSLNANYRNWDFSAFFAGQFGFSVYNNTANSFFNAGQLVTARNVTQNVVASGENGGASTAVSTRFLEKGDFVRFQNATIGYNVPLSGEGFFDTMRFSLTGQNLALWTDYSGIDPEVTVGTGTLGSGIPVRGIDWAAFPNPLTVTFGINASF